KLYPNPDVFDVTRVHTTPLLTFGGGPHRCLGGALATLEIEEMLLALSQGYPEARIAGDVEIGNNGEVQFVTSLPVIAGQRAAAKVSA
ncbi:cytochrome P450, partial [Paenarthrobacter sp. NPDC091711]|uniref:cytochrome P450 n=1 Tax=Paenarthrobacter sp. NPDC091711 TaxID=3364385 RepID=UPI0037FF6745